jgi:hypothetical protein
MTSVFTYEVQIDRYGKCSPPRQVLAAHNLWLIDEMIEQCRESKNP